MKNVLNGNVRPKNAMQHLALQATSQSLGILDLPQASKSKTKAAGTEDAKRPRYFASRSVNPDLVAELSVGTLRFSEDVSRA